MASLEQQGAEPSFTFSLILTVLMANVIKRFTEKTENTISHFILSSQEYVGQ